MSWSPPSARSISRLCSRTTRPSTATSSRTSCSGREPCTWRTACIALSARPSSNAPSCTPACTFSSRERTSPALGGATTAGTSHASQARAAGCGLRCDHREPGRRGARRGGGVLGQDPVPVPPSVQHARRDGGSHSGDAVPAGRDPPRRLQGCPVSYTHLRAHETRHDLVCRLLLEKKK